MMDRFGTQLRISIDLSLAATDSFFALATTVGYGYLLSRYTNAWAPFADSFVLGMSVLAQLLLMRRRIENWWFWLVMNSVAVPLFASRGLWLTAAPYAAYWINALHGHACWRKSLRAEAC